MDSEMVPFVWNGPQHKLNRARLWQEERGLPVRLIVLKSRKVGISTWAQAFNFWRSHLRENRHGLTLAHDLDSAGILFDIQRRFYDAFAALETGHPLHVQKRTLTTRSIGFSRTRSSTRVVAVSKRSGRGATPREIHCSELAFWEDPKNALVALRNAVPKTPDTAIILESTPKGWGTTFHEEWRRAKSRRSSYIAVFISWMDDPRCVHGVPWFEEKDLDEEERELVRLYGVNLNQLAWRRSMIEDECGGDPEVFKQEYPSDDESCFLASGRPAFQPDEIRYQTEALPDPDPWEGLVPSEIQVNDESHEPEVVKAVRGRLIILRPPIHRHHYVGAWDPSEGDPGSCASPGVYIDQVDLSVAAVWYGRVPPDVLAEFAVLLSRYYNEALLIWEANNHGLAFGNRVEDLAYHNIFMRAVSEESIAQRPGQKPGYSTRERSRQHLFNCVRSYARLSAKHAWPPILHPTIVGEMSTLTFDNEKAVAREGAAIDTLIALGMALYAHRGTMDTPLEPLAPEVLRRAFSELLPDIRLGIPIDQRKLDEMNLTVEELERLDNMEYEIDKLRRRRGLGRQN